MLCRDIDIGAPYDLADTGMLLFTPAANPCALAIIRQPAARDKMAGRLCLIRVNTVLIRSKTNLAY